MLFTDGARHAGTGEPALTLEAHSPPAADRLWIWSDPGVAPDQAQASSLTPAAGPAFLDSSPARVHGAVEGSLRRLGTDHIDLYYSTAWIQERQSRETVGVLAELVTEGKAHAVQESGLLPLLREPGIGFVSYSPLWFPHRSDPHGE